MNMMLSIVVMMGGGGSVVVVTQMVAKALQATEVSEASMDQTGGT